MSSIGVSAGLVRWVAALLVCVCAGCISSDADAPAPFVTEYGLGPDKWATAWLLTRHVDPQAELKVVALGDSLPPGRPFDVPGSRISRTSDHAAFEAAMTLHGIENPAIRQIARIIHDIEVNYWGAGRTAQAPIVERAFRQLQKRQGRVQVPPGCYLDFFDAVHSALLDSRRTGHPLRAEGLAIECDAGMPQAPDEQALVAEIPISQILIAMRQGKRVIFVDVRESGEFQEAHIPGARNITLREISPQVVTSLDGADYVVSYCVKDFRGFEMARALKDAGVDRSVILNPFGLKGWIAKGLPVVGTNGLSPADAEARMARCLTGSVGCLASGT